MKRKTLVLLLLIVVVPICLLAWIGTRLVRTEREIFQQRIRELLTERLDDINRVVEQHFQTIERELQSITSLTTWDRDAIRGLIRANPHVSQVLVLNPDGSVLHPNRDHPLNAAEEEFLKLAKPIIVGREIQRAAAIDIDRPPTADGPPDALPAATRSTAVRSTATQAAPNVRTRSMDAADSVNPTVSQRFSSRSASSPTAPEQIAGRPVADSVEQRGASVGSPSTGWFVWYWGRGLNLIYWQRMESGHIVAASLERVQWIAGLIAALPDTPATVNVKLRPGDQNDSQIRLVDSASRTVYQWGQWECDETMSPVCEIPLAAPLNAWRLQQFVPPERLDAGSGAGVLFNVVSGVTVGAVGLLSIAFWFYREYSRDMREAAQRVSFVNQVSHELRTPLTNIRMYADLLHADLDDIADETAAQPRERINVIRSESQRLSRLIGNVLAFAGQQRNTLRLHAQTIPLDDLVRDVLERFEPTFARAGIVVDFQPGDVPAKQLDADVVEQILYNLLSNVEKYAAAGKRLTVSTHCNNGRPGIRVRDFGPGIPANQRDSIFEPFWRGANHLHHAAGTGIGLTIARELARLHGGDLVLDASNDAGACFYAAFESTARSEISSTREP